MHVPSFSMPSTFPIPGSIFKLADGLGQDNVVSPAIDLATMRVTAIVCTPSVDRQSESILPEGIETDDFARNACILWEHGFDGNISTPIAKGIGPDGKLGLRLVNGALEGDAFFTNKDQHSAQIFALISEGIVKATSVHVIPTESRQERDESGAQLVTVYPRSKLLEWSFGRLGVNSEALVKLLSRGRINNEPLSESLAKSLRPYAPRAKGNQVQGFNPLEDSMPADKLTDTKPKTDPNGGSPTPTPVVPEDEKPIEPGAELEQDDSPPSVRVANAVHASLKQLMANLEAAGNTYEDPRAKEYFGGAFSEQCSALVTEVEGLIGELGGKATGGDSDKPKEGEGSGDEESADEALKSFLSLGNRQQLRVLGVASPLQSLVTAKNLRPEQKLAVQSVLKNIRKMTDDAKAATAAAKAKAAKDDDAQTKDLILSLAKTLGEAQSQLQEIAPAVA